MASPEKIRHPTMPLVQLSPAKDPDTLPTLEECRLDEKHGK